MLMNYVITAIAIAGLFFVVEHPCLAYFFWSGTNLYWCIYAWRINDRAQLIMFAVFAVSSVIQFFRY